MKEIMLLLLPTHNPKFILRCQYVNQLQFPVIKLVWNLHNNTNSTYISHFWSKMNKMKQHAWRKTQAYLKNGDVAP